MKIWLAPSAYFPHKGGVEELTFQIAVELKRRGHDVLVIAPRHPKTLAASEVNEGIPVRRIAFSAPRRNLLSLAAYPFLLFAQIFSLVLLFRSGRPDVVHVQCPSVQLPAVTLLARLAKVPMVLTSQGEVVMDAHDLYGESAFMRAALKWSTKRAAVLTACSSWTANEAARIAPRFASAQVILNGIDPDQWVVSPQVDEPIACAWGRHVPQKGLDLLVAAFAGVREKIPNALLLIGGEGAETDRLRALAADGVEFVGALDRPGVQELLGRSRVAVVPSRLEPFGIVALEAMATGRDVVWSTVGGLRDATGNLGWAVDPYDARALSSVLVLALENGSSPARARRHAESLSWSHLCDSYEQVYVEACALR